MIAIIGTTSDDILYFRAKMNNPKEVTLTGGFKVYQGDIFREDCIVAATGPSLINAGILMTLIIEKFDPYFVFNVGSVYSFSDELRQVIFSSPTVISIATLISPTTKRPSMAKSQEGTHSSSLITRSMTKPRRALTS